MAGAQLIFNGNVPPDTELFYFSGNLGTLDPKLHATDAMTGAVLHKVKPANLGTYSAMGGGINNWEAFPGASAKGVVFVQKLHPKM